MGELIGQIWDRSLTTQPAPHPAIVLGLGVLAFVVVATPGGYRLVRHGVTVLHEAGHAVVAVMVGRRLSGIRLHSDTSGVTVSRGRASGPGMVATVMAGYPVPAVVALAATVLLGAGYAVGLLWALVTLTAVMVIFVRNAYGFAVLAVIGGVVAAASWTLPAVLLSTLAHLLVWTLLLAAPRSVVELAVQRRRVAGRGSSDAAQLAGLTKVPAVLWMAVFFLITVLCAVTGGYVMLAG